jgi:hypothetical protein
MCEFYFSCFCIIRNRFKYTLNALKKACPSSRIDVGKTLATFDKSFDQELRARNSVHHREPFEDLKLNRIMFLRVLAAGEGWKEEHLSAYRQFSREWSIRARNRGRDMERVIDTVAAAILKEASFLQFP